MLLVLNDVTTSESYHSTYGSKASTKCHLMT